MDISSKSVISEAPSLDYVTKSSIFFPSVPIHRSICFSSRASFTPNFKVLKVCVYNGDMKKKVIYFLFLVFCIFNFPVLSYLLLVQHPLPDMIIIFLQKFSWVFCHQSCPLWFHPTFFFLEDWACLIHTFPMLRTDFSISFISFFL